MRPFLHRFSAVGALLLLALFCAALPAAQQFRPHGSSTLIVTNTNDNGPGSLRQALADAVNGDTIQFDPVLNGQTIFISGELVIDKNIVIAGPGSALLAVSASGLSRIFHVMPGHNASLIGLTVRNGFDHNTGSGNAVFNDHATFAISNCSIRENGGFFQNGGSGPGGGILNDGSGGGSATLTIRDSSLISNRAAEGGGIYNRAGNGSATLTLIHTSVETNDASYFDDVFHWTLGDGGGIFNEGGNVTITNSSVANNSASFSGSPVGLGGGIHNLGTLTISDSTIRGNQSVAAGGIYNVGSLTITNCTISGNAAIGNHDGQPMGDGGGIYGSATIINSTISGNGTNRHGSGLYGSGIIKHCTISVNNGAGIYVSGSLQIGSTILNASGINFDGGAVTSLGYNLSSDNGGGFLTGPGDQTNTNPLLGPLQDNGGPTFTHELLSGSPAINAGDPNFTPPPNTDQRGFLRVYNGRIDIGALEVQPTSTELITISGMTLDCANSIPGPVPNVILTLSGTSGGSAFTDSSGSYSFSGLPSGGSYTVTPSMVGLSPGSSGIDTVDTIATQKHFLQIGTPLTGCRLTAANVNGDNSINTVDVIAIQRFFLQLTTGTANVGQYQFAPPNRVYLNINTNQTGQNYDALVFGDVAPPFVE